MSSPSAQRGQILVEQGRYAEAESYFREALAGDPNDPLALYFLALCELNQKRAKEALETINRALALGPEVDSFHAFKTLALVELNKLSEAGASAEEAVRLDPEADFNFVARASVCLARKNWAGAEEAARRALDINPENSVAANQLAHALRLQNRLQESEDQTAYMLSQNPEDAATHVAAGWTALQRTDPAGAEKHFLEALRLEADNETAREGLKEAFKARSPVYRAYLNYCFFMQRFTAGKQWLVIIGLLVGVRVARAVLPGPLALAVVVLYLLFVLWIHVARAVGNFQLSFDKFARHALSRGERWEAWFVGGGVLLGLLLFLAGIVFGQPLLLIPGLTLIGASFPLAYTFTNQSRAGQVIFGAVGVLVFVVGAANFFQAASGLKFGSWVQAASGLAFLAVIVVTWLCNLRALNSRR